MKHFFDRMLPDIVSVTRRFPVPVLACGILFITMFLEIEDFLHFQTREWESYYFATIVVFLASGGVNLFAEGRGLDRTVSVVVSGIVGLVFFCLAYFTETFSTNLMMLLPASLLWLMIAGFLNNDGKFNAIWLFNSRLILAAILATIVGGLFAGGVSGILASLKYLFHADISRHAYEHVWSIAIIIIGPLYGLSLVPTNIKEELSLPRGDDVLNRGIAILINYVLVPVLLVFVFILHLYALKIMTIFELPRGQVGIIVLSFGLAGTATWLIARPWVKTGNGLLAFFTRYWFWFTIIPTVLLSIAVFERINTYGLTPDRYGLLLVAIWLAAMIMYFAIQKIDAKPQIILGSIALMLFFASFGPWGARSLSVANQVARFESLLTTWGYWKDNKLADKNPENVPIEVRNSAYSILKFLRKEKNLPRLASYFEDSANSPFISSQKGYRLVESIRKRLELNGKPTDFSTDVRFYAGTAGLIKISQETILFGPFRSYNSSREVVVDGISIVLSDMRLQVTRNSISWTVQALDLLTLAQKAKKKGKKSFQITLSSPGKMAGEIVGKMVLVVSSLNGKLGGKEQAVNNLSGWLIMSKEMQSSRQNSQ